MPHEEPVHTKYGPKMFIRKGKVARMYLDARCGDAETNGETDAETDGETESETAGDVGADEELIDA